MFFTQFLVMGMTRNQELWKTTHLSLYLSPYFIHGCNRLPALLQKMLRLEEFLQEWVWKPSFGSHSSVAGPRRNTFTIVTTAPKSALRFDNTDVCAITRVLMLRQTISYPLNSSVVDVPGKPTMCTQLLHLQKHVDPPRNTWLKA